MRKEKKTEKKNKIDYISWIYEALINKLQNNGLKNYRKVSEYYSNKIMKKK